MKMQFKKEVVNSVVYETKDEAAPTQSIYVRKAFLREQRVGFGADWPKEIEVEVKVV